MAKHTSKRAGGDADVNPIAGVTFDLDDVTFTCQGSTSMFQLAEVIRSTKELVGDDGVNMATAAESLRQVLGADEYARFVDHAFRENTEDLVIFAILEDIRVQLQKNIAAAAGRPTQQSSGSSSGEPEPDGLPARIINLGEPGGNLRTLDGASPEDLEAAAAATRKKPAQTPPTARKGSRSRQTAAS